MKLSSTLFTSLIAAGILLSGCNQETKEKTKEAVTPEKATTETKKEEKEHAHEHNHDHDHDHEHEHAKMTAADKKIYDGYFKDSQVKDRDITDYVGKWQSVYPYLQDGTLDEVFEHKAEDGKMTKEEYKDYYTTGYKTNVDHIEIKKDGTITFSDKAGKHTGKYVYDGKEILKYEKGNRGVRFIFKKESGDKEAPVYIQFSDHNIAPKLASHFHIYMGDDNAKLLKEMEHWPTYYFDDLNGKEIAHEMMAH